MQIIDQATYRLPADVRNILLIQMGDIGDVVWMTPSIRAVKNSRPDARVSVLVREGFGDLLKGDPAIDRVLEARHYPGNLFRQAAAQFSFLRNLRAQHFDVAVDLRLGDRGAFLSLATGSPIRVTLYHPTGLPWWRNFLFTHGAVPTDVPPEYGAAEQSLRILRTLGIDTEDKIPYLRVPDAVKARVGHILREEKAGDLTGWISINPFSRWSYKEWENHKWIEIINWLGKDYGIPAILIGSAEERPRAEELLRQCKTNVINLAGRTTLAELAGVLSLSRLHIGVDSAAPHIAAATGTPTVTIYGPSSWRDWAPVGGKHRVVLPEMDCVPCHRKGCDNSGLSRCLDALSTDEAKRIIHEALEGRGTEATSLCLNPRIIK